jgi:hypothetical protein
MKATVRRASLGVEYPRVIDGVIGFSQRLLVLAVQVQQRFHCRYGPLEPSLQLRFDARKEGLSGHVPGMVKSYHRPRPS